MRKEYDVKPRKQAPPPTRGSGAGEKEEREGEEDATLCPAAGGGCSLDGMTSDASTSTAAAGADVLLDVNTVDRLYVTAAILSVVAWTILMFGTYAFTDPETDWQYLSGPEREMAVAGFFMFFASTMSVLGVLRLKKYFVLNNDKHRSALSAAEGAQDDDFRNNHKNNNDCTISGIIWAALAVQTVATVTSGCMAFCPTVVRTDPVTGVRVYLVRYCQWIPMSGLMAFCALAIDIPAKNPVALSMTVLASLGQSFAVLVAYFLSFCPTKTAWGLVLSIAVGTFLTLVPEDWARQKRARKVVPGTTWEQLEHNHRQQCAALLLRTCLLVHAYLVVTYFVVASFHWFAPVGHWLRHPAVAMANDSFFDMAAKVIYMKVIVAAHQGIFDSAGRTQRQLNDLRDMVSVLWESSTDVLLVSAKHYSSSSKPQRWTTLVSPAFLSLVDTIPADKVNTSISFMMDTNARLARQKQRQRQRETQGTQEQRVVTFSMNEEATLDSTAATMSMTNMDASTATDASAKRSSKKPSASRSYFVDNDTSLPTSATTKTSEEATGAAGPISAGIKDPSNHYYKSVPEHATEQAEELIAAAWDAAAAASSLAQDYCEGENNSGAPADSILIARDIVTLTGTVLKCEVKVTQQHGPNDNAIVVIVRDVSDRYKRYQAELKARKESEARFLDAQASNRFTRHEVKNGLLAGIELCGILQQAVSDMDKEKKSSADSNQQQEREQNIRKSEQQLRQKPPQHNSWDVAASTLEELNCGSSGVLKNAVLDAIGTRGRVAHSMNELEKILREVLDTALAEAMARDVIHGVYRPKPERMNVKQWLSSSKITSGRADRFPVRILPADLPDLSIDPQLLRYIHRNAVSNALKYGRKGGQIITEVRFNAEQEELEMDVVNEPGQGHEHILALGSNEAAAQVFRFNTRLGVHCTSHASTSRSHDDRLSHGDGAWIMQKCAIVMGGFCAIRFEPQQTVFSLRCRAEPCSEEVPVHPETQKPSLFQVPSGTLGIAVSDTSVQRGCMARILENSGVDANHITEFGEHIPEVEALADSLRLVLEQGLEPSTKMLVLVDENLDYMETNGILLSGSLFMQRVLQSLPIEQQRRILILVRSGNDAKQDMEMYQSRVHGVLPRRAGMDQARICGLLARLWAQRFTVRKVAFSESVKQQQDSSAVPDDSKLDENLLCEDLVTKEELLGSLHRVELVLDTEKSAVSPPWNRIWSCLHSLKGDLLVIDHPTAAEAVLLIETMRGGSKPPDFAEKWDRVHNAVSNLADTLP